MFRNEGRAKYKSLESSHGQICHPMKEEGERPPREPRLR
jgi:hypothetical protein